MPKDPLCPLGFHPQVRWPTRCKRCFREYKEHSAKKEEFERTLLSSPSSSFDDPYSIRSRSSLSSDSSDNSKQDYSTPYSSISPEALNSSDSYRLNRYRAYDDKPTAATTDSLVTPTPSSDIYAARLRRRTTDLSHIDLESARESFSSTSNYKDPPKPTLLRQSTLPVPSTSEETVTIRLRKANSFSGDEETKVTPPEEKETVLNPTLKVPLRMTPSPTPKVTNEKSASVTPEKSPVPSPSPIPKLKKSVSEESDSASKVKKPKKKRLLIQGVQEVTPDVNDSMDAEPTESSDASADVAFIIQVKSTRKKKKEDDEDTMSFTTTTDTTETTLIDVMENNSFRDGVSSWEFEEQKKETERLKEKCDKLEKEKAEILSRRVASLETPKAQSSEYMKLQQKVNQLTSTNEDMKDEQKHLEAKIRELEHDLTMRPNVDLTQRTVAELRSKLAAAEAQVEQLMEEKRDAMQKVRDMEEEFEELQDNFREDQEYATVKKELDEATKNCRLLQFKLRKTEKRADQLEVEKKELEQLTNVHAQEKIAKLEEELGKAKAENDRLQRLSKFKDKDAKDTLGAGLKKKSPVLTKAPSGEKVEPPMPADFDAQQMLRDMQSTLERESDLREQLKFAEEESTSLRQRISRIEEENESLLIQIKKMSSRSRSDLAKGKETGRFNDPANQNGEKLDANELKLQLEINEQESKILQRKVVELENANTKLSKELEQAEDKLSSNTSNVTKSKNIEEVSVLRRKIIEKEREVDRLQAELAVSSKTKGKITKTKSQENDEAAKRLEAETKAELKKLQTEMTKLQQDSTSQKKLLEDDLLKAKKDIDNHQSKINQTTESNKVLLSQIEKFKKDIGGMKQQYESVQDDFVIKNSQLSTEKEDIQSRYAVLQKDHSTIEQELRTLRETFNNRQDTWIKEKLAMQEKMKEAEQSAKKTNIPGDKEAQKLKILLKEQSKDIDTKTRELDSCRDQIHQMQRENDELRRNLEDFDKVAQVQMRSLVSEPSDRSEKEVKLMKERLAAEEKLHKTEIAQMKLRNDQLAAQKVEELSSVQSQLSRAKRERDTFRQMVDSAQRAIAELKSRDNPSREATSISGLEEAATGARAAVATLQERIAGLEDELAEARRETSREKTEHVTENSTWEMKLGELQQKINELEEDKLLGGGSTRVRGAGAMGRTRIELAWQKERDEQQRRLKETTTLARDLKTTLLEIERERDRERTESKRRLDQMKCTMDEEQEDMRRKVSEAQCDLLELRDAHAKLRTANEKLRKDREKLEVQREGQIKKELENKKIRSERERIVEQLLVKVTAVQNSSTSLTVGPKPNISNSDIIQYLQELRSLREIEDMSNSKDRKQSHFKRAASLGEQEGDLPKSRESLVSMPGSYGMKEHYGAAGRSAVPYLGSQSSSTLTLPSRARMANPGVPMKGMGDHSAAAYNPKGSLYRKAVSLEQTVAMPDEQKIWRGGSEAGSGSSLQSAGDGQFSRGTSMDRMSTTSSKSEKPKGSGLVSKVKKFVKSRSIEETPTAEHLVHAGAQASTVGSTAGSDLSLNSETEKDSSSRRIKDKVKGLFKRSTRSPSAERKPIPSSASAPGSSPSTNQLQPPQRPSRESTPKRDTASSPATPTAANPSPSTQRPLMPSQQRPLMPSSYNSYSGYSSSYRR